MEEATSETRGWKGLIRAAALDAEGQESKSVHVQRQAKYKMMSYYSWNIVDKAIKIKTA